MKKRSTSWGSVAKWYDGLLEGAPETYQGKVILPNLLRLLAPKKEMRILDLACGQGHFSRAFAESGARVTGADISPELIARASTRSGGAIRYIVAAADKLISIADNSFDAAVIVLALQNIENLEGVFAECRRVLLQNGRLLLVLNHPCFRIPRHSSWGFDDANQAQYRRIDAYLSDARADILMQPGTRGGPTTVSFHRPLQTYVKALGKRGFAITRLEEWISHRKSEPGLRAKAEDRARKEIPLFLFLEAISR